MVVELTPVIAAFRPAPTENIHRVGMFELARLGNAFVVEFNSAHPIS